MTGFYMKCNTGMKWADILEHKVIRMKNLSRKRNKVKMCYMTKQQATVLEV